MDRNHVTGIGGGVHSRKKQEQRRVFVEGLSGEVLITISSYPSYNKWKVVLTPDAARELARILVDQAEAAAE